MSKIFILAAACAIVFCIAPTAAPARGSIDYGILGAPTTADTNEFGGLQPTPESDLHIFRYFEVKRPKALYDPHKSTEDKADLAVVYLGYQRALFYGAVEGAPKLVTPDDWKLIRHNEFDLIAMACGKQARAAARYGLTDRQCEAWYNANKARIDGIQKSDH